MTTPTVRRACISAAAVAAWLCTPLPCAASAHAHEVVAEHLPEVAMDNRFASLPLWGAEPAAAAPFRFTVQAGLASTGSGALRLSGPMLSAAVRWPLAEHAALIGFGFRDVLRFGGGSDTRPLETLFAQPPLALPAQALFTDVHGEHRNTGAGVAWTRAHDLGAFGQPQWVAGALYQSLQLRDDRAAYRVLQGPSSGAIGVVDYSADYRFLTPFAGVALPLRRGAWSWTPHALLAVPLPRRGVQGRISGNGFDIHGDTARAGNGKHVGDVSLSLGLDLTYEPWGLAVDLGSAVTQLLLEPLVHKGIERNWMLSASLRF